MRNIIKILMLSPLYFKWTLKERMGIIKHFSSTLSGTDSFRRRNYAC